MYSDFLLHTFLLTILNRIYLNIFIVNADMHNALKSFSIKFVR